MIEADHHRSLHVDFVKKVSSEIGELRKLPFRRQAVGPF